MELLSDEIILNIASFLDINDIFNFSLSGYLWLMNDDQLYHDQYNKDFMKFSSNFKYIKDCFSWKSMYRPIYGLRESLRGSILRIKGFEVDTDNTYFCLVYHPHIFHDMMCNFHDGLIGVCLVGYNSDENKYGFVLDDSEFIPVKLHHINIYSSVIRINNEIGIPIDVDPDEPSWGELIIVKEGLAQWCYDCEEYELVYPISAIREMYKYIKDEELRNFNKLVIDTIKFLESEN